MKIQLKIEEIQRAETYKISERLNSETQLFTREPKKEEDQEITGCHKFLLDLQALIIKRFIHLIRDYKTLILEVLCPIILVLVGLIITSVDFQYNSPPKEMGLSLLPNPQSIVFSRGIIGRKDLSPAVVFNSSNSSIFIFKQYENSEKNFKTSLGNLADFNNYISLFNNNTDLAGYYILNADATNSIYDIAIMVQTISQDSAPIFLQDCFSRIINTITGKKIKITVN